MIEVSTLHAVVSGSVDAFFDTCADSRSFQAGQGAGGEAPAPPLLLMVSVLLYRQQHSVMRLARNCGSLHRRDE